MQTIIEKLINSRTGIAVGLALSRIPPRMGYRLADAIGGHLASRRSNPGVQAVRANQWVIHDRHPASADLDRLVNAVYQSSARSLYEFWHHFRDYAAVKNLVEFDPSFAASFERARQAGTGLLIVVPHLSNFDLVGRAAVLNGFPLHILSYPQPPGAYRWQNRLRELPGLRVTPLSIESLRQASQTLQAGGAVLTGIDRPLPIPEAKYRPHFFGFPAGLPVFHIRLALKHKLPIVVVGGIRKPDGCYFAWASEPVEMIPRADLVQEIITNAESVLDVLAGVILKAPQQWAMFYPVWPETLRQAPA